MDEDKSSLADKDPMVVATTKTGLMILGLLILAVISIGLYVVSQAQVIDAAQTKLADHPAISEPQTTAD